MIGVSGRRQSLYTSRPWDLTLKLNCSKHSQGHWPDCRVNHWKHLQALVNYRRCILWWLRATEFQQQSSKAKTVLFKYSNRTTTVQGLIGGGKAYKHSNQKPLQLYLTQTLHYWTTAILATHIVLSCWVTAHLLFIIICIHCIIGCVAVQ